MPIMPRKNSAQNINRYKTKENKTSMITTFLFSHQVLSSREGEGKLKNKRDSK